jgi:hypothetical protein
MYFIASKDTLPLCLVFQMSFAYNGKVAQTKFIRSDDGILVIGANGFELNVIYD